MIRFDSSHTSIKEDLNNKKGKKILKAAVASGLIVVNLLVYSGCAKTMDCDVFTEHAHYYTDERDMGRYIISEKETVDGLSRTDEYQKVHPEQEDLLRFINKNGLFRISDNKEAIQRIQDNNHDYIEYEYKDVTLRPIPIVSGNNPGSSFHFMPLPKTSWTTDQSKNLTGNTRTIHYVYYGYKIIKNDNGTYKLERSPYVDSIFDLPPEYEYVSTNFTGKINLENHLGIDYEPSEELELHEEDLEYMATNETPTQTKSF